MKDDSKCEVAKSSTLDFKCKKILAADKKSCEESPSRTEMKRFGAFQILKDGIDLSTPEKASERLAAKSKQELVELPEEYKAIVDLFRQMICSLRLLSLCKKSPTFHNICSQVEILAKRKFSYKHLAQIKFILPEAVQIDKIIRHDEESQCMKPDLKITLLFEVVKDHQQKSDFMALCQLFFSRVVDFYSTHSEDCNIPEATLPEPFSQDNEYKAIPPQISTDTRSTDIGVLKDSSLISSPDKQICVEDGAAQRVISLHIPLTIPNAPAGSSRACDSYGAANFTIETPAKLTPERPIHEADDGYINICNKTSMSSEKPAKRSLDFMHEKADGYILENTISKSEHLNSMWCDIPQTSKPKELMTEGKVTNNKEEDGGGGNTCEVPDSGLNELASDMNCKMSSSLRSCVTIIHSIFQSVNYSSVTKQQLVFKILINSPDIEDRGMVEDHLEQLEKLLPNWISKRISPGGDLMYSIKKLPDAYAVLADLQS
ncbi:unnamed protein product [Rhodiola kirilowii]